MKKFFKSCLLFVLVILAFACVSCGQNKEVADPLVIKPDEYHIVIQASDSVIKENESITLEDYMQRLKDKGELDFEKSADGMISSINGIDNPADFSSCWMLYTSDTDNANDAWGTVEYEGNKYGSSALGANQLKVKTGYLYIWVFTKF